MSSLTNCSIHRWILVHCEVVQSSLQYRIVKYSILIKGSAVFYSKRYLITVMNMFSWLWGLFLAIGPLIGWGQYLPERNGMRLANIIVIIKYISISVVPLHGALHPIEITTSSFSLLAFSFLSLLSYSLL